MEMIAMKMMTKIPKHYRWIFHVAKKLRTARENELDQQQDLIYLEHLFNQAKNTELFQATNSDKIDGKNAEIRKIQAEQILQDSLPYTAARANFENQEYATKSATIRRRYFEDLLQIGLAIYGGKE